MDGGQAPQGWGQRPLQYPVAHPSPSPPMAMPPAIVHPNAGSSWHPPGAASWMEPRIYQLEQEVHTQQEGIQQMSESLQTTIGRVVSLENTLMVEIQERHKQAAAQNQMPAWAVEFQQVMQGLKEEVAAVGQQLAN